MFKRIIFCVVFAVPQLWIFPYIWESYSFNREAVLMPVVLLEYGVDIEGGVAQAIVGSSNITRLLPWVVVMGPGGVRQKIYAFELIDGVDSYAQALEVLNRVYKKRVSGMINVYCRASDFGVERCAINNDISWRHVLISLFFVFAFVLAVLG